MTDKEFQKLLKDAGNAAQKHSSLMQDVGAECERRYGVHYSDIDADEIIDVINYQGGYISVKDFDAAMKFHMSMR